MSDTTWSRNRYNPRLVVNSMNIIEAARHEIHLVVNDPQHKLPFAKAVLKAEVLPGQRPQLALIAYTAALVESGVV